MSEENKVEDTNTTPEVKEYTDIEKRAMEMGWNPDFEGAEEDFIDAKEFVRRKPLFDKIEVQSRELKNMKKALSALQQHQNTLSEAAYKKALNELKAQRQEAVEQADGARFEQIDEQIKEVEKEAASIRQAPEITNEPDVHPEFQSWLNRNPWYQSAPHMRVFADAEGNRLAAQGVSRAEILRQVAEAVKKEFPHKFRNPNKEDAPSVGRGDNRTGKAKNDDFELTDQERKIMNDLVRTGTLTKEKYIEQLKEAKGIK